MNDIFLPRQNIHNLRKFQELSTFNKNLKCIYNVFNTSLHNTKKSYETVLRKRNNSHLWAQFLVNENLLQTLHTILTRLITGCPKLFASEKTKRIVFRPFCPISPYKYFHPTNTRYFRVFMTLSSENKNKN